VALAGAFSYNAIDADTQARVADAVLSVHRVDFESFTVETTDTRVQVLAETTGNIWSLAAGGAGAVASGGNSTSNILVTALGREQSEFVRPALMRAVAASHAEPAAQKALEPLIMRGEDYFRGSVIEALGDYQATWARDAIAKVAMLSGPLQDDAIIALGKIGSPESLPVLATLQKGARDETQPSLAVATCLITRDCAAQIGYLTKTMTFAAGDPKYQALLRSASFALGALARRGDKQALAVLLDAGEPSRDPARAAIALAVGHVALRNPAVVMDVLETRKSLDLSTTLLQDAFDMLSEDFEEERFFVEIRRAYWAAAEGSDRRRVAQALIDKLEF
jgi:hypothetical protein